MSLESYLASSGVPVDDVRVKFSFELLVRVEFAPPVELVLEVSEDLFGGGVVQAVALAAHGLADAQPFELPAPPRVLVLPSHVRVQDRVRAPGQPGLEHGEQTPLLPHVGVPAHVPGDDFLAGHVVHGREVGLAARDLEFGDVGAEFFERLAGGEVAFEQVRHPSASVAPVRAVASPWIPGADRASESHAAHDPQDALGRHLLSELVDQAHMDLPVAAPVGRPFPDLCDHGIEVGARLMRRMRQMVEIRGSRQPADLQQVVEPVPLPCEQSDDGASLALRDFCARRARSFSRYATFAFR